MNIILITGASSGMGVEFALQLDNVFQNIDEIWLVARRKKKCWRWLSILNTQHGCWIWMSQMMNI